MLLFSFCELLLRDQQYNWIPGISLKTLSSITEKRVLILCPGARQQKKSVKKRSLAKNEKNSSMAGTPYFCLRRIFCRPSVDLKNSMQIGGDHHQFILRFFKILKHAIVCITPTYGRKWVSINTIGRYGRVLSQFRMFLLRYIMTFIVLGSRVFGFRFSAPKYKNML